MIELIKLKLKLKLKGKRKVIAFDFPSMGEWQFIQPVFSQCLMKYWDDIIIVVHHTEDTKEFFKREYPLSNDHVIHIDNNMLRSVVFPEIDLFITSEQYNHGLDGVYSICIFHGQAGKGMTFVPEVVSTFDAFFLLGPMHRQAFNEYLQDFNLSNIPNYLDLFEIGYPKSDGIINGYYNKTDIIWELALDPHKKTILYAPAFNEGASLREYGLQIIELLSFQSQYNVIVKLPIDCYQPVTNLYSTGGINWIREIKQLEDKYMNLTLYNNQLVDPLLACADILITCISTVGFEFMALNKPVIFIDTPKYYSGYLKRRFPGKDTVAWSQRTTANGGKEFGLVAKDIQDLPQLIDYILIHPGEYPKQQEKLETYLLYNKGRGTQAAVDKINELLNLGVKSERPVMTLSIIRYYLLKMWDKL